MGRTSYLNPALYNKLYAAMQYENALALRVALETGLRIDDVLHLRSCDLTGRTLSLITMKTGKPAKKVISADLARRLRQIERNGRLFDGRFGNKPRTRQTVWRDVKKAAKLLKLGGNIAPHSARKTYAVEDFKDNGIAQTQKDLQHDRLSTTMLYCFADMLDTSGGAAQILQSDNAESADSTDRAKSESPARGAPLGRCSSCALDPEDVADAVVKRIEPLILSLTKYFE